MMTEKKKTKHQLIKEFQDLQLKKLGGYSPYSSFNRLNKKDLVWLIEKLKRQ